MSGSYSDSSYGSNTGSNDSGYGSNVGPGPGISVGRSASKEKTPSIGVSPITAGTLPLPFMQSVQYTETDPTTGRIVRRERKVAPRIDWLGGRFFFAGLKRSANGGAGGSFGGEGDWDFEVIMEGPWARRRRGPG
jgi:hypothetical protein